MLGELMCVFIKYFIVFNMLRGKMRIRLKRRISLDKRISMCICRHYTILSPKRLRVFSTSILTYISTCSMWWDSRSYPMIALNSRLRSSMPRVAGLIQSGVLESLFRGSLRKSLSLASIDCLKSLLWFLHCHLIQVVLLNVFVWRFCETCLFSN